MSDKEKFGLFEDADVERLIAASKFDIRKEDVEDQHLAAALAGPEGAPLMAEGPTLTSAAGPCGALVAVDQGVSLR